MATTNGNKDLAECAKHSVPQNSKPTTEKGSWADRVETVEKNMPRNARFYIIKNLQGTFAKVSPFFIQKSIQSLIGEIKSIKKLRSGDLLVEVGNAKQAGILENCKNFGSIPINATPHNTLNTSRGVISEQDLIYVSESEILENLQDQGVVSVRRINIKKEGSIVNTKHIILTFDTPTLPKTIKAGYLNCSVRQYIPNPLRCFKCQRFGHSQAACRGSTTCARCASSGHESEGCTNPPVCVNCRKDHPSYSRSCEKFQLEKEIQAVRTRQTLSYFEAKKIVTERTPVVGLSYAGATSKQTRQDPKILQSVATQTDDLSSLKVNSPENKTVSEKPVHNTSTKSTVAQTTKEITDPQPSKLPPSKSVLLKLNQKNPITKKGQTNLGTQTRTGNHSMAPSKMEKKRTKAAVTAPKNSNKNISLLNKKCEDPTLSLYASDLSAEDEDNMSTSSGSQDDISKVHI